MSTFIQAPYPKTKVTSVLPDPQEPDSRGSQSEVQVVRGVTSKNTWTYVTSSDKVNLSATWIITRAKDEEVAEFIRVYHTARWKLTFGHESKSWIVELVGEPIRRRVVGRQDDDNQATGNEAVQITMNFSAEALQ